MDGKEDPRVLHAGLVKGGATETGRVMDHARLQLDIQCEGEITKMKVESHSTSESQGPYFKSLRC